MTEVQKHYLFIKDMAAFLRFAYTQNMSDGQILSTLVHDIAGVDREGFKRCFSPRVTGYAEDEKNAKGSWLEG
jgi:hypothetical protein